MLTGAVPGVRVGYDPCEETVLLELRRTQDFAGFVTSAMDAALNAEMIYLYYELVLAADRAGFNMIAAFHEYDVRVDAWTIRTVDATTLPLVERLLALKVDQITTDDPEGLAAALGASR
jgi:glycerophosphoryl diester phosphodiesterase